MRAEEIGDIVFGRPGRPDTELGGCAVWAAGREGGVDPGLDPEGRTDRQTHLHKSTQFTV